MKPRLRAEWVVLSEQSCIVSSRFSSPMSKNSDGCFTKLLFQTLTHYCESYKLSITCKNCKSITRNKVMNIPCYTILVRILSITCTITLTKTIKRWLTATNYSTNASHCSLYTSLMAIPTFFTTHVLHVQYLVSVCHHTHNFNSQFSGEVDFGDALHSGSGGESLWISAEWHKFIRGSFPSCCPTKSVKSLMET